MITPSDVLTKLDWLTSLRYSQGRTSTVGTSELLFIGEKERGQCPHFKFIPWLVTIGP